MSESMKQIYDRAFKRIFEMSDSAIVDLINGLFGVQYPRDSKVSYPNKEFVREDLTERIADVIVVINDSHTYHLEAQLEKMDNILLRVFDYGYSYASWSWDGSDTISFPEPVVVYIGDDAGISDEMELKIRFGTQGVFSYRVSIFRYLNVSVEEMNRRSMVVLIPFQLLRLRGLVKRARASHKAIDSVAFDCLYKQVLYDILKSIEMNLALNNIKTEDASMLRELTSQLYKKIREDYLKAGGDDKMGEMLPGALELPSDKYIFEIRKLRKSLQESENIVKSKDAELESKDAEIEKMQKMIEELQAQLGKS